MEKQTFVEIIDVNGDIHVVNLQSIAVVEIAAGLTKEERSNIRKKLGLKPDNVKLLRIELSSTDTSISLVADINPHIFDALKLGLFLEVKTDTEEVYLNPSKIKNIIYNVSNPWRDYHKHYDFKRDLMYTVIMDLPIQSQNQRILPSMSFGDFKKLLFDNDNNVIYDNETQKMKKLRAKDDDSMVFSVMKQKWLTKKWDDVKDGFKEEIPDGFDMEKHFNDWYNKKYGKVKEG